MPSTATQTSAPRPLGPTLFGRRIFYGWYIVAACVGLTSLASGIYVQGLTTFFLPITREFDVQRGTLSLALSMAGIGEAIIGPFGGMLVDRYGPRRLMMTGVGMMGLGFFLIAAAPNLALFLLAFLPLVPMGMSLGLGSSLSAGVANWFARRRGLAFAFATLGFGLGGLLVPGIQFMINLFGWRGAAVGVAIVVWVAGLPLALVMRRRPEDHGLFPDGASSPPEAQAAARGERFSEVNYTVREAVRSRAFWFIGISFGLRMVVVASMNIHFVPILKDEGVSETTAAAMLGLFSIVTLPTRLGIGYLADHLPKNLIAATMGGMMTLAVLVLVLGHGLGSAYVFVVLYAIAWGGSGAAMVMAIRAEYFGRQNFATISGLSSAIMVFGTVGGPTFTGFSYDKTGGYGLAFAVFIGTTIASSVMMLMATRPGAKRAG